MCFKVFPMLDKIILRSRAIELHDLHSVRRPSRFCSLYRMSILNPSTTSASLCQGPPGAILLGWGAVACPQAVDFVDFVERNKGPITAVVQSVFFLIVVLIGYGIATPRNQHHREPEKDGLKASPCLQWSY